MLERFLESEWTALAAFVVLLSSLGVSWWQYLLATIVYVHLKPAPLHKEEQPAVRQHILGGDVATAICSISEQEKSRG